MIKKIKIEPAKKVITHDFSHKENGWLLELFKAGGKTVAYLTVTKPGSFKGYHLHRVRAARYVCIKGKVKIIIYKDKKKQEFILDAANPQRLFVPNNIATGLENVGKDDAWLINYPDPAFDPDLKDEQVEYTEVELKAGVVK